MNHIVTIQHLKRGGALLLATLYFFCQLGMCALAVEEDTLDSLRSHGIYTVGYSEDYLPFSYQDNQGNLVGMSISLMDYIAQMTGIQVLYVSMDEAEATNMELDISLAIMEKDKIDGKVTLGQPYTELPMVLMGYDEELNLQGALVGRMPYTLISDEDVASSLEGCTSVSYDSYQSLATAYMSGEVDYILVSSIMAYQSAMAYSDREGIKIYETDISLPIGLVYTEYVTQTEIDAFEQVVSELDINEIYSLMLSAVMEATNQKTYTARDVLEDYSAEILASVLLILLLVVGIIYKMQMSKRHLLMQSLNEDDLTGFMTERKFIEDASERLKISTPVQYVIISIDIDNFKAINEVYGYEVGTKVILGFGEKLREIMPNAIFMARAFADNFLIMLDYVDQDELEQYQTTDVFDIEGCLSHILGQDYRLMTSAGIYPVKDPTLPLSYMVDCANIARRRSKELYGRTQVYFTEDIAEDIRQKNSITSTMETALQDKEFKIHYQPKIDFKTKAITGAEALVRWYKEDGTQIYPDAFIPLFEQNGFVVRLDYYVADAVCDFLKRNPKVSKVSINLSGYSLLMEDLVEQILAITQRHGIDPSRLEIEITETAIVTDFETVVKQTAKLRRQGFSISMDDFGAGLSSLNRLKDMDIDVLKIDQVFLGSNEVTQRSISILDSIIQMSRNLGITTVAEGVETQEQVALLERLCCDIAQGYYYARPLPEDQYLKFVSENTSEYHSE